MAISNNPYSSVTDSIASVWGDLDWGKLAGYAPPPPPDLAAGWHPPTPTSTGQAARNWEDNPALLAFMRQYGFDKQSIMDALTSLKERNKAQLGRDALIFEDTKIADTKSINQGWEDRGLFRTGQRIVDVAERGDLIDQEQQMARDTLLEEQNAAEEEAARKLAQLEIDKGEAELSAKGATTSTYA